MVAGWCESLRRREAVMDAGAKMKIENHQVCLHCPRALVSSMWIHLAPSSESPAWVQLCWRPRDSAVGKHRDAFFANLASSERSIQANSGDAKCRIMTSLPSCLIWLQAGGD